MNRNFAFRLCGELAKTGTNLYCGISTGNLTMTCINAGIELIDMTSSIISWGSERNRTRIMQESLNETTKNYERLKEDDRRRVDLVIGQEMEASRYRLEKLRIELEKERSLLMNQIEQLSLEENSKAELLMRKSELTARIRIRVKDTIPKSAFLTKKASLHSPARSAPAAAPQVVSAALFEWRPSSDRIGTCCPPEAESGLPRAIELGRCPLAGSKRCVAFFLR